MVESCKLFAWNSEKHSNSHFLAPMLMRMSVRARGTLQVGRRRPAERLPRLVRVASWREKSFL